jgi:hypothetical protein
VAHHRLKVEVIERSLIIHERYGIDSRRAESLRQAFRRVRTGLLREARQHGMEDGVTGACDKQAGVQHSCRSFDGLGAAERPAAVAASGSLLVRFLPQGAFLLRTRWLGKLGHAMRL